MHSNLPTGTVTFLFTDIENSTPLWEKHPEAMKSALAKHDSLVRSISLLHNGRIIKTTGDGFHVVFATATDAVQVAIHAQQAIQKESWDDVAIKVRMGIHTGEAELRDGDYFGGTLNLAARIMSIGHGGQILISETTLQIAQEHLSDHLSVTDLGEHRLKGLSKIERIFQISTPDLQQEFPALKSLTHISNNLPTQLTSFIGRERELEEAQSKLENARLLTLIGPGGTGKTRLSIQLGAQLLSSFKDGVWWVEFAPISDPSLVMQTIASVYDIGEVPGVPLKMLVHDFVREKHLLLILDNCEHLVDASARVVDEILHVAPKVKIIVSSREALGINGETVYRVPSLSLPNQDEVTKEAALRFESVMLFVERASAANPKFHLTDENASSVAQICSRLDGIPLAIELAASRITVFSPEQIAKRLDDRFKLLTGGSRTALPRQQTLRALIDWSYELLSDGEQALLRRLSVFAGGWTFETAETICNNVDVFEHLPKLVNKSLVTMNDEGDESRYFLVETIRQYARDKLLESGEGEGTRRRHFTYYLAMAETAYPEMMTREKDLYWAGKLETEYDNIRAAVNWGLAHDPIATMRLIRSLTYLFVQTNYSSEGHRWGEEALKHVKSLTGNGKVLTDEENLYKAKLLASMSVLALSIGDTRTMYMEAEESTNLLRTLGDTRTLAGILAYHVGGKLLAGNIDEALASLQEAQEIADSLNDKYIRATVLNAASFVELYVNKDYAKVNVLQEEASELIKVYGSHCAFGITMYGFGNVLTLQKQFGKAREKFQIALQTMRELRSPRNIIMIKSDLAHIYRQEGNYVEALPAYHETIKEWQRMGHRSAVAHQLECLAFIAKSLEQVEKATKLLAAAEALRQRIEIDMNPFEHQEYEKEVADLKANMDGKEFASLWAEGRSMTMEQAIQFALAPE